MEFKTPESLPTMNLDKFINDPKEREWAGPFTFVLGADPQFGMMGNCKFETRCETWDAEMQLMREAIQKVNEMSPKPKFFLFCGDMLDALPFPSESLPNPKMHDKVVRDKQYQDFVKVVQELDSEIKPVFVCGNHDVGDVPTEESIEKYRAEFGPDFFTFWVGGVKFVVVNSQYFYSPGAVQEETDRHLRFLEENMPDADAKHIVVFQHIPFFGQLPDEDDLYCNIPKNRRLPLLEMYHRFGVRHIFCGHYHRNAGGMYKNMEQVVTAAMGAPFGDDPSGFRVVHVNQDEILHNYIKLRETTDCTPFEREFLIRNRTREEEEQRQEALNEILSNGQPNFKAIQMEEMEQVRLANSKKPKEKSGRRQIFNRR